MKVFYPILLTLLLPLFLSACMGSGEDKYELKSPCVSYSEGGLAPCERRKPEGNKYLI